MAESSRRDSVRVLPKKVNCRRLMGLASRCTHLESCRQRWGPMDCESLARSLLVERRRRPPCGRDCCGMLGAGLWSGQENLSRHSSPGPEGAPCSGVEAMFVYNHGGEGSTERSDGTRGSRRTALVGTRGHVTTSSALGRTVGDDRTAAPAIR